MDLLDGVAVVLMCAAVLSLPVSLYFAWRQGSLGRAQRIFFGLLFGTMAGVFFYYASITVVFRDGMGP